MTLGSRIPLPVAALVLLCAGLKAQVPVSGRVVDETGAVVAGARVEIRPTDGGTAVVVSSDPAGKFVAGVLPPGDYNLVVERQGFYLFRARAQRIEGPSTQITVALNHIQEFAEKVDVVASPTVIDPQQPSDRKELDHTEIQSVPYPAPQDYRNALPLFNGVVQDNAGRAHFNGGETNQTNYTLDGFNISDPVTGRLETRLNIDAIQSMDLESSRFSAENGRGSAGVLDLHTKMGDDRWRFAGTNFIPGVSTDSGIHVNKWTPRLEFSGPLAKGRAWFHNGFDAFYYVDLVSGLPHGQNQTHGLTGSDLSRFQVNVTPANILTGSFLMNLADNTREGLSFLKPAEATLNRRQTLYMSSIRDQQYFGGGALVEFGFADTRGGLRTSPQGDQLYEITPFGDRGNYYVNLDRHFYRQQWIANIFLPVQRFHGEHQLKFGIDFEREAFHQDTLRHDYEVLRDDNSVARYVTFAGNPFQQRKNFEGAQYVQDHWSPREGLSFEAGLRAEWNEVVRDLEVAPRVSAAWSPGLLHGTKISAGWGVYYDSISLATISRQPDQVSLATFFPPGGEVRGPVPTAFHVNDGTLRVPYYRMTSLTVERKLPFEFFGRAGYMHRAGGRGFTFANSGAPQDVPGGAVYELRNSRRDQYDAFDISVKRTFAGQFEWFAGYTRSSARANAVVDYSLENPIFAPQMPGPLLWDAPNRFHMWGWAPLSARMLPRQLEFLIRNTSAQYLLEWRTGFPFSVTNEEGFLVGRPNSLRLPAYFNINLFLERKFRAIHYLWAWRFGFSNLTNNGNPNVVNTVMGTANFLTYGRGQARAFSVRLRLLSRK
jgi:hypothetical protein